MLKNSSLLWFWPILIKLCLKFFQTLWYLFKKLNWGFYYTCINYFLHFSYYHCCVFLKFLHWNFRDFVSTAKRHLNEKNIVYLLSGNAKAVEIYKWFIFIWANYMGSSLYVCNFSVPWFRIWIINFKNSAKMTKHYFDENVSCPFIWNTTLNFTTTNSYKTKIYSLLCVVF